MALTDQSNTNVGAPVMSGQAGALIGVLDYCLVTILGWAKTVVSTNIAVYRQPSGTNQFYLYVDDTGTNSARVVGYESWSGTGTNPFPTTAQFSGGLYVTKSSTANSTARPWRFLSDGKLFHLVIGVDGTTPSTWSTAANDCITFGDIVSYKPGDAYNTILIADINFPISSAPASYAGAAAVPQAAGAASGTRATGHYLARAQAQTGTSYQPFLTVDGSAGNNSPSSFGLGALTYPGPISGGIEISRVYLSDDSANGRRGRVPGLWCWLHSSLLTSGDTFSGASGTDLTGRSFVSYRLASGCVTLETSDTWSS